MACSELARARSVLHWGLETGAEDLELRWAAYRESLITWNESLNRNLAMTARYFGDLARATLESEIQAGFRQLNTVLELERCLRAPPSEGCGSGESSTESARQTFQDRADSLNVSIYRFNDLLIRAIQDGAVGTFIDGSESDANKR